MMSGSCAYLPCYIVKYETKFSVFFWSKILVLLNMIMDMAQKMLGAENRFVSFIIFDCINFVH